MSYNSLYRTQQISRPKDDSVRVGDKTKITVDTDNWTLVASSKKHPHKDKDQDRLNVNRDSYNSSYTVHSVDKGFHRTDLRSAEAMKRGGADGRSDIRADMRSDSRLDRRSDGEVAFRRFPDSIRVMKKDQSRSSYRDRQDDRDSDDSQEYDNTKYKNDNYKKILCKNINSIGKCIYTNKCLYAHSLDEQNVEPVRAVAYDMIKKDKNLSGVDLTKNKQLYANLMSLSKLCQHCEEGSCTGGYNCKHGACDKIYVVCQVDLNKGTCEGGCGKVHLTKKGLVPYGVNVVKNIKVKVPIPKSTVINDAFFKRLSDNVNLGQSDAFSGAFVSTLGVESNGSDLSSGDSVLVQHDGLKDSPKDGLKDYQCDNSSKDDSSKDDNFIEDDSAWDDIIKHESDAKTKKIGTDDAESESDGSDDDDFLGKLPKLTNASLEHEDGMIDIAFKREEKLKRSIFRIDMLCV
ncbi:hypothetical protein YASMINEVIRUS_552 [Yasminevirus sp. GU-2018]|uniref:C3H1-type domain-containing protein n=1 Tax=Yasminevirus sp. GU-2018 TaxID=2420051 RepID=A0A5K0U7S1_9VIRU|nr:hypothetical protein YASMINEVIRUS_552 [Yasminevirus sp. GU-2018]